MDILHLNLALNSSFLVSLEFLNDDEHLNGYLKGPYFDENRWWVMESFDDSLG